MANNLSMAKKDKMIIMKIRYSGEFNDSNHMSVIATGKTRHSSDSKSKQQADRCIHSTMFHDSQLSENRSAENKDSFRTLSIRKIIKKSTLQAAKRND